MSCLTLYYLFLIVKMVVVVVVVMCLLYFFDLMVVIVIIVLLSSLLVVGLVVVVGTLLLFVVLLLVVFVGVIGKYLDVEVNILIVANVIGVIVSTDGCIRHRVRSGRRVWKKEAQEETRKPKCRTLP